MNSNMYLLSDEEIEEIVWSLKFSAGEVFVPSATEYSKLYRIAEGLEKELINNHA